MEKLDHLEQIFLHIDYHLILNRHHETIFPSRFSILYLCCGSAFRPVQNGAPTQSTDDYNQSQFWIGNFPEGQYVVHLSRIVAVAQHKYILDNACMVYEVTLVTMGNTPTKFYYLETLGQNSRHQCH